MNYLKPKIKKSLYVFCLFFLLTTLSAQQKTGAIKGTITTADGKPAPLVCIKIKENNKKVKYLK